MDQGSDPMYSTYISNSVLNACLSYTAMMLNILTIHALRKTSSLPKTLKTLLLSLAVSDLGVGLMVQPLYSALLVENLQQKDAEWIVTVCTFTAGLFAISSFLGVTALSVDRFLAVHLHLRYQELVTHKRVVVAVIILWLFSALIALLSFWDEIILFILLACISTLCVICCTTVYCKIYFAVRRLASRLQHRPRWGQEVRQDADVAVNADKLRKFALSTFYVFLVFLICYLPHTCMLVARILIREQSTSMRTFDLYSLTLVYLNSTLNPVVYSWKIRHIRLAIMNILRKLVFCNN
ncbi:adenosine receptor A3-like [Stylophora pistillata]|uniref:adenosine receptor A3-like n=1 Tax=Stylophora pistillata TaxID=50429 RepID=UPI000C04EA48|nr:adenosine receptor A3-like [Stylophora pistillata]